MKRLLFAMLACVFGCLASSHAYAQHEHHHDHVDMRTTPETPYSKMPLVFGHSTRRVAESILASHPGVCPDKEFRISFPGFDHCRLHGQYQVAFKNWNCHCYSGQCRPTQFRTASAGTVTETGYEIMVENEWFPIPRAALRTERALMTPNLLEYEAHVCTSRPFDASGKRVPPHIECAWISLTG